MNGYEDKIYYTWYGASCICVRASLQAQRSKGKNSYIFLAVVIISTYGDLCHYFIHMVSNLLYAYTHILTKIFHIYVLIGKNFFSAS